MYLQSHPKITCSRESFQELTSFIDSTVPYLDLVVDHADLDRGSLALLRQVFPAWFHNSKSNEHIDITQCKDGITNKCTNSSITITILTMVSNEVQKFDEW